MFGFITVWILLLFARAAKLSDTAAGTPCDGGTCGAWHETSLLSTPIVDPVAPASFETWSRTVNSEDRRNTDSDSEGSETTPLPEPEAKKSPRGLRRVAQQVPVRTVDEEDHPHALPTPATDAVSAV